MSGPLNPNAWQSKELRMRRYEAILQRQKETVQLLMENSGHPEPTRSVSPQPTHSVLYTRTATPEPLAKKRYRCEKYLHESGGIRAATSYRAYTQQEPVKTSEAELEPILLQYERKKETVDKEMEYLKSE